jgi:hypothetical protein
MRTTLTIEDRLLADLKRLAHRSGKPFKQVVEEALRTGLAALEHPAPAPYRLQPESLGQPRAEVDLIKALALANALEDDALREKLGQRR